MKRRRRRPQQARKPRPRKKLGPNSRCRDCGHRQRVAKHLFSRPAGVCSLQSIYLSLALSGIPTCSPLQGLIADTGLISAKETPILFDIRIRR